VLASPVSPLTCLSLSLSHTHTHEHTRTYTHLWSILNTHCWLRPPGLSSAPYAPRVLPQPTAAPACTLCSAWGIHLGPPGTTCYLPLRICGQHSARRRSGKAPWEGPKGPELKRGFFRPKPAGCPPLLRHAPARQLTAHDQVELQEVKTLGCRLGRTP